MINLGDLAVQDDVKEKLALGHQFELGPDL